MKTVITSLLLLLTALPAAATTIHVPGDQPNIQSGINAASFGDTVLVACGVYQPVNFWIELKSGVCLRSETGEPDCVVIDGRNSEHSVFLAFDLSASTIIDGISVINQVDSLTGNGVALNCNNSPIVVKNCNFTNNHGHGVGAVALRDYSHVTFENCNFTGNQSNEQGGAVYCEQSSPTFADCVFAENSIDAGSAVYPGGGAAYFERGSFPEFTRCTFSQNVAIHGYDVLMGGAVYCDYNSTPTLTDCVFYKNTSIEGGAVCVIRSPTPTISGCTFSQNKAPYGSAILCDSGVVMSNSIIAFSDSAEGLNCGLLGVATVECCNIYGNEGGNWVGCLSGQFGVNGNISVDPLFCDTSSNDYQITTISLCAAANNDCGTLIGALDVGCIPDAAIICPSDTIDIVVTELDSICVGLAVQYADEVVAGDASWSNDTLCFLPTYSGTYTFPVVAANAESADSCEVVVNVIRHPQIDCPVEGTHDTVSPPAAIRVPLPIRYADLVELDDETMWSWNNDTLTFFAEAPGEWTVVISASNMWSTVECEVSVLIEWPGFVWHASPLGSDVTGTGSAARPFATIRHTVEEARNGDTILLGDGVFTGVGNYNTQTSGKPLVMLSENGPSATTIDGMGFGRAFEFRDVAAGPVVLRGVTIIEGRNQYSSGGALAFVYCSSVLLEDCIIRNSSAKIGGGVSIYQCSTYSIVDCVFQSDTASSGTGGALNAYSILQGEVIGCVFSGNHTSSSGGAIYAGGTGRLDIRDCRFYDNSGLGSGGVMTSVAGILERCVFSGNVSTDGFGGALFAYDTMTIRNCSFEGNHAMLGGGISLYSIAVCSLSNSIIAFNSRDSVGTPGGLYCWPGASVNVVCTDMYGNEGGDWEGCAAGQAGINGNISLDPLFCDMLLDDFYLQNGSPCAAANNTCSSLMGALDIGCGGCCLPPSVGDINQNGEVDITDIQVMIDHQFLTLAPLACDEEGDINSDGMIDITDLQIMIDYQFLSLTEFPPCP